MSGTDSGPEDLRYYHEDACDLTKISQENSDKPRHSLSVETLPVEDRVDVFPDLDIKVPKTRQ